jgi:hypothetical protein
MRSVFSWRMFVLLLPVTCQAANARCDARVLLVGGDTDQFVTTTPSSTAELYDPKTETFTRLTNNPSTYGTATLLPNGRVLITGFGIAELYRPKRKDFVSAGNLLDPGHDAAVRLTDGDVLLYGKALCIGFQLHCDPVSNTAEVYHWRTGKFIMVKSSISAGASVTLLTNDQVLLANEDIDIFGQPSMM